MNKANAILHNSIFPLISHSLFPITVFFFILKLQIQNPNPPCFIGLPSWFYRETHHCSVSEKHVIIEDNKEFDELITNEEAIAEEVSDEEPATITRPQRNKQIPRRLQDCQVVMMK